MASSRVTTPNTMAILDEDNQDDISSSMSRPTSRQSSGSRICRLDSGLSRRTPTPTKQVFLTSVRRKDSGESHIGERPESALSQSSIRNNGFYGDVQAMASKFSHPVMPNKGRQLHGGDCGVFQEGYPPHVDKNNSGLPAPHPQVKEDKNIDALKPTSKAEKTGSDDDDTDPEGDNGGDGDGEAEEEEDDQKAPSQLLMEFVGCLMEKDYKNAEKLCKMILLYEPENPEALKFQPLIQEKLEQEEDDENTDDESGDDEDDEDDDDDDDDDDDSDSEDSGSEESSSEEEGNNED